MEALLAALALIGVMAFVAWPFMRAQSEPDPLDERRESLELAKQVKYREIRDLELDMRAGKIDRDEWEQLDRELRREAIAILAELDGSTAAAIARGVDASPSENENAASSSGREPGLDLADRAPRRESVQQAHDPARPIL